MITSSIGDESMVNVRRTVDRRSEQFWTSSCDVDGRRSRQTALNGSTDWTSTVCLCVCVFGWALATFDRTRPHRKCATAMSAAVCVGASVVRAGGRSESTPGEARRVRVRWCVCEAEWTGWRTDRRTDRRTGWRANERAVGRTGGRPYHTTATVEHRPESTGAATSRSPRSTIEIRTIRSKMFGEIQCLRPI